MPGISGTGCFVPVAMVRDCGSDGGCGDDVVAAAVVVVAVATEEECVCGVRRLWWGES